MGKRSIEYLDLHAAGPLYMAVDRYTFSDRQSLQFVFIWIVL